MAMNPYMHEKDYNQALQIKEKGNQLFQSKQYEKALHLYRQAIEVYDKISIIYSNAARCCLHLNSYEDAIKYSRIAINKDQYNIKAYILLGQCLCIQAQQKLDLHKVNSGAQVFLDGLQKAKLILYPLISEIETFYLKSLKLKFFIWEARIQEIIKRLMYLNSIKNSHLTQQQIEKQNEKIRDFIYNNNFILQKRKTLTEHPEFLCCSITLEPFVDPVITSAGISYERKDLMSNFIINGYFDPVTRIQLYPKTEIPNYSLIQEVLYYFQQYPWLYEYNSLDSYKSIQF